MTPAQVDAAGPARIPPALGSQLQAFLDHLTVERGLSPNTIAAYRRDLERYGRFCGANGIEDAAGVDEAAARAFLAWLSTATHPGTNGEPQPYRTSSVARTLAAVRSFHRFLVAEGELDRNPAAAAARPKVPRSLPRPLPVDETARLVESPNGEDPASLRDRAMLETMYGAGLRVSELVGLDVDDVDLEGGSVRVIGKGSKQREVPLGTMATEAVAAYLTRGRPSLASSQSRGALFLNRRGGRLTRQGFWQL